MPGKNSSLNHPTQGDSRNAINAACQPPPKMEEVTVISLILAHQHKALEYPIEIHTTSPKLPTFRNPQNEGPSMQYPSRLHTRAFPSCLFFT